MTLSDERLREQAEHVLLGVACGKPDVADAAKVLAEMVLSRRPTPSVETGRVTDAMVDRACEEAGWVAQPYTAPRESGVPTENDMSEADAAQINADMREAMRGILAAALSASPGSPGLVRNESAGFYEFVSEDVPTTTGPVRAANVEPILRMGKPRGEVIGFRVWDASPGSSAGAEPFAWHWWAKNHSETWPVWSQGAERPAHAPDSAIALYKHPPAAPPQREGLKERKGIYIASKVKHAHRWRLLRDKIGYPIISTWIDEAGEGESQDLADLWARCTAEASNAEVLVFNAERGELFKGAWIELGCALSHGVPVLAVGLDKIDGLTVAHDKRIRHFPDMAALMKYLKPMVGGTPFRALTGKGGE